MKNLNAILFVFVFSHISVRSQCAMCRAVLESEETGINAAAINDGIVYLMFFPYLLAAIVGYLIYRVVKKNNSKSV